MELLAISGVGGIIEQKVDGADCILIQERYKEDAVTEAGLIEIPAGKIRAFENIYDCLRREIREETGLEVTYIEGEDEAFFYEANGYKVLNYTPFSSNQNVQGSYPIMVQVFICKGTGKILKKSNETKNIRWISLEKLKELLENNTNAFYPMHIATLTKYLAKKLGPLNGMTTASTGEVLHSK